VRCDVNGEKTGSTCRFRMNNIIYNIEHYINKLSVKLFNFFREIWLHIGEEFYDLIWLPIEHVFVAQELEPKYFRRVFGVICHATLLSTYVGFLGEILRLILYFLYFQDVKAFLKWISPAWNSAYKLYALHVFLNLCKLPNTLSSKGEKKSATMQPARHAGAASCINSRSNYDIKLI
jgi:hypothetical protein